jgi:hypothetical protein
MANKNSKYNKVAYLTASVVNMLQKKQERRGLALLIVDLCWNQVPLEKSIEIDVRL